MRYWIYYNDFPYRRVHRTALHEAVRLGWTEGMKILLNAGAKCTMSDALEKPLVLALQNKGCLSDLIELLLKHGADPNDHDDQLENIPLLNAIKYYKYGQNDNTIIVKLLLEHGADPNVIHIENIGKYGETKLVLRTALHEAASQGWTEGVKMLLDVGAKCTTSDAFENPLALALQNQDCSMDLIRLLIKHGADPNDHDDQHENIPLLNAIENWYCQNDTDMIKLLLEHGANPHVTHMVDVGGYGPPKWVQRTALYEAVVLGWTEVVKMLLDAGTKFTMSDASHNPLALALQNENCPIDLIELLLKHISDSNYHKTDKDMPLIHAIINCRIDNQDLPGLSGIVKLLLEHGANPTVVHRVNMSRYANPIWVHRTALHQAASRGWTEGVKILLDAGAKCVTSDILENPLALAVKNNDCPPDLIELLLKHGADVNYTVVGDRPLLHKMSQYTFYDHHFLDLFFLHGGNINLEDSEHRTALEHAIREGGHINSVRWLIRHGADALLRFSLLKELFEQHIRSWLPETHLILMQSGLRVSYGTQMQLRNMEVAISTCLQDDTMSRRIIYRTLQDMWDEVAKIPEWGPRKQANLNKYLTQQMIDLQEFSDESLQIYPQDTHISPINDTREGYQHMVDQIHGILEFLSQPQSLQWYCLNCIRENIVSLHPSVVKTLPIPSKLKRYILCHEI